MSCIKSRLLVCPVHCNVHFYLLVRNISSYCFKDEIIPLFKSNDGLKFAQDVAMNHVRKKGMKLCKLVYKIFDEQDGYDRFLGISPFPILIQLEYFLGGIQHFVTVVGK